MLKRLPNILTFLRLVLTLVFLGMLLYAPGVANRALFLDVAFVIFLVAGVTDVIDGHVARRFDAASKFGRMMDPLVDKILVCGTFVCLAVIGQPRLFDWGPVTLAFVHWIVAGVIIVREAYVTVLRHWAEAHGINFAATKSGKIKMLVQSVAIGAVVIKMGHVPDAQWGHWVAALVYIAAVTITVISGLRATQRARPGTPPERSEHDRQTSASYR
jgi:CDP-diacylglycerol--glycerol-3-phosphate 3-phosphatidyltransferase